MTADEEDEYIVAQANEPLDENGHFVRPARLRPPPRRDSWRSTAAQVDYMDVSPKYGGFRGYGHDPVPGERRRQPRTDGLQHAASGRASAGHRAAASWPPAWSTRPPRDSGVCVLADHDGTVEYVDADKIIVRCADGSADTYELIKFMRSNQGTCINQRPIVNVGETRQGRRRAWPTAPRPATARSAWARTP